jgi:predicted transcriptional regulator
MYTYIVERTQIYLSRAQAAALDREARRTGTTRSHLIREAIEARYGNSGADRDRIHRALETSAGLWRDRDETGADYIERIRSSRRLRELSARQEEAEPGTRDR